MRARGKNAKKQQDKNCFPISAEQCWDQQPFKGKVHTGRNWVSFCNECCRNYLCIGLEEMVSKAASNSILPMLHTSMSAQGATSPVLCLLTNPALSLGPRTLRKDAEGARRVESKISFLDVHYVLNCVLQRSRGSLEHWTWSGDLSSTLLLPISSPSGR